MIDSRIDFDLSGADVLAAVPDMEEAVAQEGLDRVQARLGHVLRHPTGRYRSSIAIKDRAIRSTSVYHGWLEGVSSRNTRSRFKGYTTFRKVAQQLQDDVGSIAQPIMDRRIS